MKPCAPLNLSIVIPCLNESHSLEAVLQEILLLKPYEIVVVDNGSTDNSVSIARKFGVVVVEEKICGYGQALLTGIKHCQGDLVAFLDADGSYPAHEIPRLQKHLEDNNLDLVLANRLKIPPAPLAMPFLNRYLGTPLLSFLIRHLYQTPIYDCNSGMRIFRRQKFSHLFFSSQGMEFASEMLVRAALKKWSIGEVPIRFRRDTRGRPPHLRRWRDGLRHLRTILSYLPEKFRLRNHLDAN